MTADIRGHRLRAIAELRDTHLGRVITVPGDPDLTGTLVGLVPVGSRIQAVINSGGARIYTDAMPGDTFVEVWGKGVKP